MAFTHSKNARLWIDALELTAYFNDFTMAAKAGVAETTVYGKGAKTYIGGLKEGVISGKGFFDAASQTAEDYEMVAALGRQTNMAVTFAPNGVTTAGTRCIVAYAAETDYGVMAPVTNVVATSFSAQADSGLSTGVWLYDPTTAAIVTDTTTNGTYINDTGGASAYTTDHGLVANLHVETLTGASHNLSAKLQHSDDHSTWADLCSFGTTITAPGGYSAFVAYGTPISRYLRAVLITTGTISLTCGVSAARQ